jgi:hypothetical protein
MAAWQSATSDGEGAIGRRRAKVGSLAVTLLWKAHSSRWRTLLSVWDSRAAWVWWICAIGPR